MKKVDLYAELGVRRGASAGEIKAAYRRRAKATHPDAGGSEEAFGLTSTAVAVLSDPRRRERYDRTGEFEVGGAPDNALAEAVAVVQKHVNDAVNPWFASGLDPAKDPRRLDVLALARAKIAAEVEEARRGLPHGHRLVEACEDLASRFSGKSGGAAAFLRRHFLEQAQLSRRRIAEVERGIATNERALALLADDDFRFDPPPAQPFPQVVQIVLAG